MQNTDNPIETSLIIAYGLLGFIVIAIIKLYLVFNAMNDPLISKNNKLKELQTNLDDGNERLGQSRKHKIRSEGGTQMPVINRHLIGANWEQFNTSNPKNFGSKQKRMEFRRDQPSTQWPTNKDGVKLTKYISMDCEMVGVGYQGKNHMLARVSIVNQMGDVLMDKYVQPREEVTDYRTSISGIRPKDIKYGANFLDIQREVTDLLQNRILVGHAIYNDLKVLYLSHSNRYIRDTSKYRPLQKLITGGATPSLKTLVRIVLGYDIQDGEHNSVEDARAAMRIYNKFSQDWEKMLRKRS